MLNALATLSNTRCNAGGDFITEGGNFCPFMASASLQALPPQPTASAVLSGNNFILTWPASATGFTLESAVNLAPPVVWTTNSPAPVLVNGQNTVTDPISGTQKFYRLIQ